MEFAWSQMELITVSRQTLRTDLCACSAITGTLFILTREAVSDALITIFTEDADSARSIEQLSQSPNVLNALITWFSTPKLANANSLNVDPPNQTTKPTFSLF